MPADATPTPTPLPTEIPSPLELPGALKSGWQTTEFWVCLGMMAAAVVFLYRGKDELAMGLLSLAGVSYNTARMFIKRAASASAATASAAASNATAAVASLLLLACLSLTGCTDMTGYVRVDGIEPLMTVVMQRHDRYVQADTTLTPERRDSELRSTTIIRQVLAEAKNPGTQKTTTAPADATPK